MKIKLPILQVNNTGVVTVDKKQEFIFTKEACKRLVDKFVVTKKILLFIGQTPIGRVINLEYEEENKQVIAEVELHVTAGSVVDKGSAKFLEVPQGKRLIDIEVVGLQLMPNFETLDKALKEKE